VDVSGTALELEAERDRVEKRLRDNFEDTIRERVDEVLEADRDNVEERLREEFEEKLDERIEGLLEAAE
jgi:hypothetical protein